MAPKIHPLYAKVTPDKFFVCGEFDPATGSIGALFLAMPVHVEILTHYKSGDIVKVNGKEYVLGPRSADRNATIAAYELVLRKPVQALEL